MPLPGLARADRQLFVTGQFQFTEVDDLPRLGPLFNARSCAAGPTMIRTAPLWGVRAKSRLLHDGRAEDVPTAISLHDGQGRLAAQAIQALSNSDRGDLLNFLGSI
jgi:CxxC motif-containing protein (DUF1111 family)